MKVLMWGIVIVVVLIAAGDAYVRRAPIDPARYAVDGLSKPPGDYPETGGFQGARKPSDPAASMSALDRIIRATARTQQVAGSVAAGHASYVTRSSFWGFPDVTNVWISGDTLQIRGHLVFGSSDLGVNAKRIKGWLDEAGL
ncbi:DUF1499 domain-containing protein [Thioclava indica]|uniref:DUF1499 domain-containing protein n=1 Tax=Thioclava indica TaxID=1353528 RepID=A0A074JSL8_9RHOB|nr:DUF1499 domain-containing protein [Thioclava indica]KEO60626.1 hypothetical protein DT23_12970 [Thioclava indica]